MTMADVLVSSGDEADAAQLEAELAVQGERENAMALAFILFLAALGAGYVAWQARLRVAADEDDTEAERDPKTVSFSEL